MMIFLLYPCYLFSRFPFTLYSTFMPKNKKEARKHMINCITLTLFYDGALVKSRNYF
jgi:hypothetical protein